RPQREVLAMTCRPARIDVAAGSGQALVPVRLSNRGRHPEADEGPCRTELVGRTLDADGATVGPELTTPLPGLLVPGQEVAVLVRAAVPERPGRYVVNIRARRPSRDENSESTNVVRVEMTVSLMADCPVPRANFAGPLLAAQAAQQLPDDYVDVSEGRFAKVKLWIKHKLLHNFQHAYVNV